MRDGPAPRAPRPRPAGAGGPPRRGSAWSRALFRAALGLAGWRVEGRFPARSRLVVAAAPHTSNWDFVVGMGVGFALGVRLSWMGKHTLFTGPLRPFLRWLGGIPIDRTARHGVVDQMVAAFQKQPRLLLVVTPEGTRSRVTRWKSGFWHIARGAGVPILLVALDYRDRRVEIGPLFTPGDDPEADLAAIRARFANVVPCHPQRF